MLPFARRELWFGGKKATEEAKLCVEALAGMTGAGRQSAGNGHWGRRTGGWNIVIGLIIAIIGDNNDLATGYLEGRRNGRHRSNGRRGHRSRHGSRHRSRHRSNGRRATGRCR
jgi:hypothetical protein